MSNGKNLLTTETLSALSINRLDAILFPNIESDTAIKIIMDYGGYFELWDKDVKNRQHYFAPLLRQARGGEGFGDNGEKRRKIDNRKSITE